MNDQRQPTFLHLESQFGDSSVRPPRSAHVSRAASQASARTWIYNTSNQPTREPPSIIIPIAPPEFPQPDYVQPDYPPPEDPVVYDGMDGAEYMNIDPNGPDLETDYPAPPWSPRSHSSSIRRPKKKGGLGGFFRRLRKLPKTIFTGRRRRDARNTLDLAGDLDLAAGMRHLDRTAYDDHSDPEQAEDVYLDAPSMPIPEPAVIPGPPPSRSAGMSLLHPGDNTLPSRAHSRASHRSRSRTPVPHRAPTPSEALSARLRSPVHSEPLLQPPNVRKPVASRRASSAPSRMSQVFRFDKFFRDLKSLPWISTRITVDYVPGEGRRSHQKVTPKTLKSPGSWYKHPRHSLDLLSSGASASVQSPYSPNSRGRNSSPSLSSGHPSLASNRGTRRRTRSQDPYRRYGHGYPVYPPGFSPYPFGYSPQPLFVMQPPPSQVNSPPSAQQQQQQQQTSNLPPTTMFPELCQAVPVYVVPPSVGSPPLAKPSHERKHSKKRTRDQRHPEIHPYPLSMPGHPP